MGLCSNENYGQLLEQRIQLAVSAIKTQIDRARLAKRQSPAVTNAVYHVYGHNPRWVTNSIDNSVNIVTVSSEQVFADLRQAIESGIAEGAERKDILEKLDALEKAQSSPSFAKLYTDLIATAANHMSLIAPFIPALTELLHRAL